jgi:hypothetical protein
VTSLKLAGINVDPGSLLVWGCFWLARKRASSSCGGARLGAAPWICPDGIAPVGIEIGKVGEIGKVVWEGVRRRGCGLVFDLLLSLQE